jgi:hypothetical protein
VVAEWLEREPNAASVLVAGGDRLLTEAPWPGTIAAWALGIAVAGRS